VGRKLGHTHLSFSKEIDLFLFSQILNQEALEATLLSANFAGSIGNEILRRFSVILNYPDNDNRCCRLVIP